MIRGKNTLATPAPSVIFFEKAINCQADRIAGKNSFTDTDLETPDGCRLGKCHKERLITMENSCFAGWLAQEVERSNALLTRIEQLDTLRYVEAPGSCAMSTWSKLVRQKMKC